MDLRALIFLGLLIDGVLIASEVSGGELAEIEQIDENSGVEEPEDRPHRGEYRRGFGGRNGGGNCGRYGCCGGRYNCRCCTSAAEAETYAAAQAKAKLQN